MGSDCAPSPCALRPVLVMGSDCAPLSQRTLQRVVVVLEALQLEEVFGSLALLVGRQVGDLDGAGRGALGGMGQLFRCSLVLGWASAVPGLKAVGENTDKP
ncbi:hypothetical protein chiPu_0024769 [Chiloscyllium punctatum]|uniref:Uncharacterized protein n=1 Tax=Chiloscyllium punctatum TaxID=137246 RepID=A0A401TE13_CHIPU|nr:hypothetical protein [Chiloscyllium punctatum]